MNQFKKYLTPLVLAFAVFAGVAGGAAVTSVASHAADSKETNAPVAPVQPQPDEPRPIPPHDPHHAGHEANGVTEQLLTGDTADKVSAAAKAAVPDGTIERVETDAEGSPYEAHITKNDGTQVTVKVDNDFKATSTDTDHMQPAQK